MTVHSFNYYSDNYHLVLDQTFHCLFLEAFSGLHYRMQTKWNSTKSHINCWLEECEQTLTAGQTEAKHLIENPSYSVCMSRCCRENGEKNIWHKRLFVNNLQGRTEHVRPTKTIQLQALRLPFSARAWSNPCFVLIGLRYRHQGENGSQDTQSCFSKMNKAVREVCSLGGNDEEIKKMMEEGRWLSASCGLRIIQQKHTEEEMHQRSFKTQGGARICFNRESHDKGVTAMMWQWRIISLKSLTVC